jgi:acyl-CoA dehydrogenase
MAASGGRRGAGDPRCKIAILMGKTNPDNPKHSQQSQILVPLDAKGINIMRPLTVFGYDDAPHGHMEIELKDVRVPARICCSAKAAASRLRRAVWARAASTIACARLARRKRRSKRCASASPRASRSARRSPSTRCGKQRIADARIDIEMTRLLCLKAAYMMDTLGNKVAKNEIAMIKVAAPRMALKIIDDAIQAHGGAGVCQDFGLAKSYAGIRTLRLADGPDEVHARTIALNELAQVWLDRQAQEGRRRQPSRHALMLFAWWIVSALALRRRVARRACALGPAWAAKFVRLQGRRAGWRLR